MRPAPCTGSRAVRRPAYVIADEIGGLAFVRAGEPGQLQGIADHVVGGRHAADDLLQFQDSLASERGRDRGGYVRGGPLDDVEFLIGVGIIDERVEHEPIELGLGQRIRSFLLDGFCVASTKNG